MQDSDAIPVVGTDGPIGVLAPRLNPGGMPGHECVVLPNGRRILVASSALLKQQDGTYRLPLTANELAQAAGPAAHIEETVVPVIAEELIVGKRAVPTGGIRVNKVVREHEEVVAMPLIKDHVDIRRVVVNRDVDGPMPVRHEGETTIIPIVEEVIVVEKRMRLKEELHITRRTTEEHAEQRVTLQREEAVIERFDAEGRSTLEAAPESPRGS
jgi:uncharacterized protein (TIGR02271 family)